MARKLLTAAIGLATTLIWLASTASGQVATPPNILLIMTDDQEASTLEYMPNVQAELVAKGTTYTEHTYTFPLCCPSRATMLTGLYPHNTGVFSNGGFDEFKRRGLESQTRAVWLNDAGYYVTYSGKYVNGYNGWRPPGYDHFWSWRDPTAKTDGKTAATALEQIREAPADTPFFTTVSFHAPHTPFYYPKLHGRLFGGVQAPRVPSMNEDDVSDKPPYVRDSKKRDMKEVDAAYRKALRSLQRPDEFVGDAISVLEQRGELEDTYILFVTDNGTHYGYHRLPNAKETPYEEDVNFPLIVRGPGVGHGTDSKLVGNHDIAPTIADMAGVTPPDQVDGTSIFDAGQRQAILIRGGGDGRGVPRWDGLRTDRYTYAVYRKTGFRELYDRQTDPYQLENIAPEVPEIVAELHARMQAIDGCSGDACRTAEEGGGP